MSAFVGKKDRNVLPRMRRARMQVQLGEGRSFIRNPRAGEEWSDDLVLRLLGEWKETGGLSRAADVVGAGLASGHLDLVREAASEVIRRAESAPHGSLVAARAALGMSASVPEDEGIFPTRERWRSLVGALRVRLPDEPRNPFVWSDLALAHANLGDRDAALGEMDIACKLAPRNRIVIRTATRLYSHFECADRSLNVIDRSGLAAADPWITAGDLAVRRLLGSPPQNVRRAKGMIADAKYSAASLSELRAALGTLECSAGERRKAKRLFRASLEDASDNALAQFAWAAEILDMQADAQSTVAVPHSFEASALMLFRDGRWQETADQCLRWLGDEPYSARPAILGSFVAAELLSDLEGATRFLEWGLSLNEREFGLLNNQSYCMALSGRVAEAQVVFGRISEAGILPPQRIIWLATRGLIEFRSGNHEFGRRSYAEAIEVARRLKEDVLCARAMLSLAREELNIFGNSDLEAIAELIDATARVASSHASVNAFRERVLGAFVQQSAIPRIEWPGAPET